MKEGAGHWSATAEAGAAAGLNLLYWAYRFLGRWPFYALLAPVTLYFFAVHGRRRRASREYLERLWARGALARKPGLWTSFRHFWTFAASVLDKLASWHSGLALAKAEVHGQELTDPWLDAGRGFVVFSAHLGNLEALRVLAYDRPKLRVTVLVHTKNARNFNSLMARLNPGSQLDLVQVSEIGPDTAILLKERVERGGVVVITADRTPGEGGRSILAPFLGAPAPFPQGPFILASLLACPVCLLFCVGGAGRWRLYYEPFAERLDLPRASRERALEAYAARFAARLEHYCALAPLQWQNFYPFWTTP